MATAPCRAAAFATASADTVSVSSSVSPRIGRSLALTIAWTAPQKVSVGVRTGAPCGRSRPSSASWIAAGQELTATAYWAPTHAANSRSNSADSLPGVTPPGSEEGRGGEEGRSRWAPDHLKKKNDILVEVFKRKKIKKQRRCYLSNIILTYVSLS